jgi:hypothetical protein
VRLAPPLALLTLLGACTPSDPNTTSAADPSGPATTSSGGIVIPTTSEPTSGPVTTGEPMKLDLPPQADLGNGMGGGCGAVDLLFIVDNSKSMGQYQAALADAFPQFVDAMYANLPEDISLHVGITTTDFTCAKPGDPCCPDACPVGNTQCQIGTTPEEVELLMSFYNPPTKADNGVNGSQGRLFEHEGLRFFTGSTSDDPAELKKWFTGAAIAAGEQGSSLEMPVAAAAYALDPVNAATNAGFVRDTDAILLIVFLTNDPDGSLEPLKTYEQQVLAAKQDCPECILTAGLLRACVPDENQRLWQFMTAFGDDPIWRDIEAKTKYPEVVGAALASALVEACENIPVG